ncbi:hypothetical protein [Bradyrhizobium sp. USDA 4454]
MDPELDPAHVEANDAPAQAAVRLPKLNFFACWLFPARDCLAQLRLWPAIFRVITKADQP